MHKHWLSLPLIVASFSFAQQSLSLQECMAVAKEKSGSVRATEQDLEAAKEVRNQARTHWYPTVTAQATALRSYDDLIHMKNAGGNLPVYDGNPANLATASQFAYMPPSEAGLMDRMGVAALTVTQPVYMGGRVQNGNKLAQIGVDLNQIQLELARVDAAVQSANRYWNLVALHTKMQTLQAQIQLMDTLAHDVKLAHKNGLATSRDTLELFLRIQEATNYRLQLQDGIALSEQDLCRSLDEYCKGPLRLSDSLVILDHPEQLRVDHDQALVNRKEYRLLDKSVEAQVSQNKRKGGEFLPQVLVGAAFMEMSDFETSPQQNAVLFANASIPISGMWERHHHQKESSAKEKQARIQAKENQKLLRLEMDKAWNELNASWRSLQLAQISIQKERQSMEDSYLGFRSGMEKASDLLEAQLRLQLALDQEISLRKEYLRCRFEYLRTTARDLAMGN